jgi:hypothetical protein
MSASATLVFLVPLVTAIASAHLAGHWWAEESFDSLGRWQAGGGLVGLIVGVVAARGLIRYLLRRECEPLNHQIEETQVDR